MANVPKKTLVGVVGGGAAAAALLVSVVPEFEGAKLVRHDVQP